MSRCASLLRSALLSVVAATLAHAQPAPCNCPWREYAATPTPQVLRLFEAAERADTTAFLAALRLVQEPDSFVVDETPLVAAIIWARRWPDGAADARSRTYQTVPPAALDSLRDAHRSAWPARERMLAAALDRGVDPNAFTIHGMPPLVMAARFRTLQRLGVLQTRAVRLDDDTPGGRFSAPVLTMSIGLRRSTLALVSATSATFGRRDGGLLLGLSMCQRDVAVAVAAAARKRGAWPFSLREQRELCQRVRAP